MTIGVHSAVAYFVASASAQTTPDSNSRAVRPAPSAASGNDCNPRGERHERQCHGIVGGEGPEELRCTEHGEKERGEVSRPAIK